MIDIIKNNIETSLAEFPQKIDKLYSLNKISPLLFESIAEYIRRPGKRIRPLLFVIGYLGFAKKQAAGLYTSALAIELLHDFMLIHDDIIDKSDTRRGRPSMHKMLNNYLKKYKDLKFNGQDLSIVIGDVIYAIAVKTFLSVKENMARKEKALNKFIEAAMFTGAGEFIELINGLKLIEKITKEDIFKIYDYKTAYYTFSMPLVAGAILGGAKPAQIKKLYAFGVCLGRAFQIKDDILGIFASEKKIGKSVLCDLQESKKTLLIWQAYNSANVETKTIIKNILSKKKVTKPDLLTMRKIITETRARDYAKKEVESLIKKAETIISSSKIKDKYKKILISYPQQLLK